MPTPPRVETVLNARLPNGMAWSADGRTMFWIDSATNKVDAFDFDAGAGALRNRRTAVTCPRQGASVHGAVGGACSSADARAACGQLVRNGTFPHRLPSLRQACRTA